MVIIQLKSLAGHANALSVGMKIILLKPHQLLLDINQSFDMNKLRKITMSLPETDVAWINAIALIESKSQVDILIRAIRTEKLIAENLLKGNKLIIEYPDGHFEQIIRV